MLDKQQCVYCTNLKDKVMFRDKRGKLFYKDLDGNLWHGARCPDCYKAYKESYDEKYRIKRHYIPLGTIMVCNVCKSQYEMENGSSNKVCNNCRKKS